MKKITKPSKNKGKGRAQNFFTLRFSATKGFDSSQPTILESFKRTIESQVIVDDQPSTSNSSEVNITATVEKLCIGSIASIIKLKQELLYIYKTSFYEILGRRIC